MRRKYTISAEGLLFNKKRAVEMKILKKIIIFRDFNKSFS
tara:strand:- start:288 stop:407 length:120 start_codon:yes stop_codon:yes gene_type:complete